MSRPIVYKQKKLGPAGLNLGYETNYSLPGKFIGIGVDFEEFHQKPGNYSTAIIEKPDGEVISIPIEMIKFTDNG
jgi:hypothetical protein